MQKSIRLSVLVLSLSFGAISSLRADQTGTNPHPRASLSAPGVLDIFIYTVRSYLGL